MIGIEVIVVLLLAIIVFFILATTGWVIGSYNTFVSADQDINNMWSNIKTEYQRRSDLFYNLVETTKAYIKHEKGTLTELTKARAGNFGNTKIDEAKNMKGLEGMFSRLLAVVENYPNLKAVEQTQELFKEIRITEDRINVARTEYNGIVRDYNILIKQFPKNMIARRFGFEKAIFFENEKETDKAPKIDLKI